MPNVTLAGALTVDAVQRDALNQPSWHPPRAVALPGAGVWTDRPALVEQIRSGR